VKIDVDTNPTTANQFGILSIPTLIFFRDGQPVDQRAGALSKEALRSSIEQRLVA
jgi:thioredoxin 1